MAQRKDRPRISDTRFVAILNKQLNAGDDYAHVKTVFFEKYIKPIYAVQKGRALQLHDKYYGEWAVKMKAEQDKLSKKLIEKGVKNGLRSRLDRMLFYQKEVDALTEMLEGKKEFTFVLNGRMVRSHQNEKFVCPVQVLNEIRKQIKDYQTEISRAEGDYAPIKTDVTTDGKPVALARITTADGTQVEF